jgi:anti-sigma factor RsiW
MNKPDMPEVCLSIGERIEAYLDGALTPADNAEIAAHLASCPECRADLACARHVAETLHSLPPERCPDRVVARVYARFVPQAMTIRDRWRMMLWRPALVGAFAVGLLVVTSLIGQRQIVSNRYTDHDLIKAEQEARWALEYVGLLGERAGRTVKSEVIDERILVPVVRTLERSLERDKTESKREVRNAG